MGLVPGWNPGDSIVNSSQAADLSVTCSYSVKFQSVRSCITNETMCRSGSMRRSCRWCPRNQNSVVGRSKVYENCANSLVVLEISLDIVSQESDLVGC